MLMDDLMRGQPGYALKRASAAMLARLNSRLDPLGVRHAEAAVMVLILAEEGVTQSEIGKVLGIQSANMAPLVTRLASRGLLVKRPLDGKSLGLFLTDEGRALALKIKDAMDIEEGYIRSLIPEKLMPGFLEALDLLWTAD